MKSLLILLLAITVFPVSALAEPKEEVAPVGRYDITSSFDGIYFLDTATGALWLKPSRGQWKRVDSPVNRSPKADEVAGQPVSLTLPKRGKTIPMTQREKRTIPGSSDTLFVQLGDITGGQVFVEVIDINGRDLIERTSLKSSEFVEFKVGGKVVYLQIIDMVNNLLGEDICKVHISFKKPKIEPKDEESKAVQCGDERREG